MTETNFDTSILPELPDGFAWSVTGDTYEGKDTAPDVTVSLLDAGGAAIGQEWIDMAGLERDLDVSTTAQLRRAIVDACGQLLDEAAEALRRAEDAERLERRHRDDVLAWNRAMKELGL